MQVTRERWNDSVGKLEDLAWWEHIKPETQSTAIATLPNENYNPVRARIGNLSLMKPWRFQNEPIV